MLQKQANRLRRKARVSAKITGTPDRPRLSVFRSNTHIYAQIIDDTSGATLGASSDLKVKDGTKLERAQNVGKEIAEFATKNKISEVVFDRNGFLYHGRVKALADAARQAGLKF